MICPRCNSNVNEGSSFCMNCGANLNAAQVQPTPSVNEVPVQPVPEMPTSTTQVQPTQQVNAAPVGAVPVQPVQQPVNQQNTQAVSQNDNKGLKILAYLSFLVFIPIFSKQKNDPSVKFHIGQGLVCFVLDILLVLLDRLVIYNVFRTEVKVFGYGTGQYAVSWLGILISDALYVAIGVFALIGIINACKGEDKELPVIGKFAFYK